MTTIPSVPEWRHDAFNGLIERSVWSKGKKSIGRLGNPMVLPVEYIFIHHSVTPVTESPIEAMWNVNNIGINRFGMHSYSYNFWPDVGGSEHRVLQGQGGLKGAHSGAAWNSKAFGMCWIGNFETNVPGIPTTPVTASMLHYTAAWIGYLIDNGVVSPNVTIKHHAEIKATACPGDHWIPEMARLRELVSLGYRMSSYVRDFIMAQPAPAPVVPPTPEIPEAPVEPEVPSDLDNAVAALDNAVIKLQFVTLQQGADIGTIDERSTTLAELARELAQRVSALEAKPQDNMEAIIEQLVARLARNEGAS